jgi:hypothetical protein
MAVNRPALPKFFPDASRRSPRIDYGGSTTELEDIERRVVFKSESDGRAPLVDHE